MTIAYLKNGIGIQNLNIVNIEEHKIVKNLGKKFALTLGIKASNYDHLLLTDADCYPKDEQWISSMLLFVVITSRLPKI